MHIHIYFLIYEQFSYFYLFILFKNMHSRMKNTYIISSNIVIES